MNQLEGKVAYITGGSKGIGLGIAEKLVAQGMRVAITSRSQEAADKTAQQLRKLNRGEVLAFQADVRKLAEQKQVVEQVVKQWGQLDLIVANAGLGHFAPIDEMSEEQWHEVIDTNLTGVFNSIKAGVESLKKSEGYFFTVSSLAGTNFFPMGAAYNASKFGVTGFTQAVMLDLRSYGVKTSTIMPGSVATHFAGHSPDADDYWKIQPEDMGQMVLDLLEMNPRTLPSKIEVRPSQPPKK